MGRGLQCRCTKTQPRRPILTPFRSYVKKWPDSRLPAKVWQVPTITGAPDRVAFERKHPALGRHLCTWPAHPCRGIAEARRPSQSTDASPPHGTGASPPKLSPPHGRNLSAVTRTGGPPIGDKAEAAQVLQPSNTSSELTQQGPQATARNPVFFPTAFTLGVLICTGNR